MTTHAILAAAVLMPPVHSVEPAGAAFKFLEGRRPVTSMMSPPRIKPEYAHLAETFSWKADYDKLCVAAGKELEALGYKVVDESKMAIAAKVTPRTNWRRARFDSVIISKSSRHRKVDGVIRHEIIPGWVSVYVSTPKPG